MSNYNSLKATINANIKTNGNQEITGSVLNSVLNAMVNTLGAGYQYAGVATPSSNPGTPDAKVFYIAATAGTYTDMGGLVVNDGETAVLVYNGTWTKQVANIPSLEVTDALSKRFGLNSGIYEEYSGTPTSQQIRFYSAILAIVISGVDTDGIYSPYVVWGNNGGTFSFRVAKYNGTNWSVVYQYSVAASTINPNDNNLISFDNTIGGIRVVATLDVSKIKSIGAVIFALTSNPPLVFSKNCFNQIEGQVETLEGQVETLEGQVETLEGQVETLEGQVETLPKYSSGADIVSEDDFIFNGFIIKTTGVLTSHSAYKATDFIPVIGGTQYAILAYCAGNACVGYYDKKKNYLNNFAQNGTTTEWTLTIPDGVSYIRISANNPGAEGAYLRGVAPNLKTLQSSADILKRASNNVWKTYGDMSRLNNVYENGYRWQVYEAFRQVKFKGCDPSIPRTIFLAWNINNTNFQFRISQFDSSTNAWVSEFQYNEVVSEIQTDVKNVTITSGSKSVKVLIDASVLPNSHGSIFNALTSTPEMVFSSECYDTEEDGLSSRVVALEDLGANKIVRLFPNTKLPVISFEFDDIVANDDQVVSLFDSYGAKANFAFIASDAKLSTYGKKYLQWQKNGHGILSHSINGTIFNTDNYTPATALAAFQESKNKLEKAGFVINGWASPSSQMAAEFIDGIKATYAYAFTYGSANNRQSNPCTITRYSLQSNTIAEIEAFVDSCISGDNILTFYGHAADFGNTYNGEVWNIAKLTTILQYVLAKRDLGLVYFDNTDNCIKYYFDL